MEDLTITERLEAAADRFIKWAYNEPFSGPPVISIPRHPDNIDALLLEASAALLSSAEAREEAEQERDELQKALTGLTCGGSEFFVRKGDRFAADIDACVAWVRRSKEDAHRRSLEAIKARQSAEARAREAEGRVEELEKALREIADRYEDVDLSHRDFRVEAVRSATQALGASHG